MSSLRPPREGLTLEYLFRPFGILLHPVVSASLLFASIKRPDATKQLVYAITKSDISLESIRTAFKILLTTVTVFKLNKYLSRLSLNNFVTDRSWDWQKEIVVCTGGSSGIGKHVVDELARRGIQVVILDINPPTKSLPENVSYYKVDLTSKADIQEVSSRVRQEKGHPTVLINNAGTGTGATILNETDEGVQRTFDVNILAHFKLIKEFVPYMVQRNHGHIVTIASMASFVSGPANVSYSATKAGALALHEGLGSELRTRYGANKVRTTIVHPFWVRTPLTHPLTTRKEWKEFTLEPETVAEAIVAQILKGESAQLILPSRFGFAGGIRGWPGWLQELIRGRSPIPG
ncbi:hypothetical protein PV08_11101 [Exophiala spinifera]|uniref:Short-chain dehydrogenase/reductase 3 n=1 Tax=Exophiala spinifera TaxID=91928 RepID=A0A0D2AUH1_9EURO|nr:uncharacterized protein PV08_11101 [Exophiala spinifera]KIW10140.1 hypothetical protein PV08_11101 [Exophiala spinifera]